MPKISNKIVFHLPTGGSHVPTEGAIAPSSPPLAPPLVVGRLCLLNMLLQGGDYGAAFFHSWILQGGNDSLSLSLSLSLPLSICICVFVYVTTFHEFRLC